MKKNVILIGIIGFLLVANNQNLCAAAMPLSEKEREEGAELELAAAIMASRESAKKEVALRELIKAQENLSEQELQTKLEQLEKMDKDARKNMARRKLLEKILVLKKEGKSSDEIAKVLTGNAYFDETAYLIGLPDDFVQITEQDLELE